MLISGSRLLYIYLGLSLYFCAAAFALDPPHDYDTNAITCGHCHTAQLSAGTETFNNACLTCHRPGHPLAGAKAFMVNDAADPFGRDRGRTGESYQTSHAFSGVDTCPQAGAQPPLDPRLNKVEPGGFNPMVGTLSCVRCHNQHSNQNPPFLRVPNGTDELCRDCHRSRDIKSHLAGSHPVLVSYSGAGSAWRNDPSRFQNPPININPANPTSALPLKAGLVVCTTCHGVHHTDSNSATFDSFSGAIKSKDGYLLRTDPRGKDSGSPNLCRSCHTKSNHNSSRYGQNVQCVDCHGGHVEYAGPNASAAEQVPNVWLIRRFLSYSGPGKRIAAKTTFFQFTGSQRNYADANGTGICQACHQVPQPGAMIPGGGVYPAEHGSRSSAACAKCHGHSGLAKGSGSFSAGCTGCHGSPPLANIAGGPNGYAVFSSAATGRRNYADLSGIDESKTPHARHAAGGANYSFSCSECHQGNRHLTGSFQDIFLLKTGLRAVSHGAYANYSAPARSCVAVYCHSNGAPHDALLVERIGFKSNPKWREGAGTIRNCDACHDAVPATNAHHRHAVAMGYACETCHFATAAGSSTIKSQTLHPNGTKDVIFLPWNNGIWNAATATCSNVSCHGRATPKWTDATTGICGSCHAVPATSNAHTPHLAAAYGPKLDTACDKCHIFAGEISGTHANGTVDLKPGGCQPCHAVSPAWTPGRLDCQSCHAAAPSVVGSVAAPYQSYFGAAGHGKYGVSSACTSCHDADSPHISSALGTYKRLLGNLGSGADNTECTYCHNGPQVVSPTRKNLSSHVVDRNDNPAPSRCNSCHDPHGTSNLNMIRSSIVFNPLSAAAAIVYLDSAYGLVDHTGNRGLCQVCHTKTNHYRRGVPENNHPASSCLSCHSHRDSAYAFRPAGTCNSCHGYPPAPRNTQVRFGVHGNWSSARFEDYSGGGGAHILAGHVPPQAKASEGWKNCTLCHNGNIHRMTLPIKQNIVDVSVKIDQRRQLDMRRQAIYSSALMVTPPRNVTGACTNIACHFKASPKWSSEK